VEGKNGGSLKDGAEALLLFHHKVQLVMKSCVLAYLTSMRWMSHRRVPRSVQRTHYLLLVSCLLISC
jgi:hypothetical protein